MGLGTMLEDHPHVPILFANTLVSKVIQFIKSHVVDPILLTPAVADRIQSMPKGYQTAAEWIFHALSGVIRSMPEQNTVFGILFHEALAESLTQTGIGINELSNQDRMTITEAALPYMRVKFKHAIQRDSVFQQKLTSFFGTAEHWHNTLMEVDGFLSDSAHIIEARRAARKTRGFRRWLPWT